MVCRIMYQTYIYCKSAPLLIRLYQLSSFYSNNPNRKQMNTLKLLYFCCYLFWPVYVLCDLFCTHHRIHTFTNTISSTAGHCCYIYIYQFFCALLFNHVCVYLPICVTLNCTQPKKHLTQSFMMRFILLLESNLSRKHCENHSEFNVLLLSIFNTGYVLCEYRMVAVIAHWRGMRNIYWKHHVTIRSQFDFDYYYEYLSVEENECDAQWKRRYDANTTEIELQLKKKKKSKSGAAHATRNLT